MKKNKKAPVIEIDGEEFEEIGSYQLDEPMPSGVQSDVSSPSAFKEFASRALEATEVPASVVRAGLSPEATMSGQIENLTKYGSEGIKMAPTGADLLKQYGVIDDPKSVAGQVAGFGADIATDPLTFLPTSGMKAVKAIQSPIKTASGKQAARSLSKYVTPTQFMKENIDPNILGARLVEEDLVKHITKPEKLKEVIQGVSRVDVTPQAGKSLIKKNQLGTGLIADIADDIGGHISQVSKSAKVYKPKDIINAISMEDTAKMFEQTSGLKENPARVQAMEKILSGIVNKSDDMGVPAIYTLDDMYTLKKNLSKQVHSKEFYKGLDEAQALEREAKVALIRRLDDLIAQELSGHKIGEFAADKYYQVQNNRMHHLLQLSGLLDSVPLKELKSIDMTQAVMQTLSGAAAGGALGSLGGAVGAGVGAGAGALGGAGFMGIRAAGDLFQDMGPALTGKALDVAQKAVPYATKAVPQAARNIGIDYEDKPTAEFEQIGEGRYIPPTRSPDSVAAAMSLPKQLIKTTLPRTTEGLIQNKKLLLAKIAQQHPEMFEEMRLMVEDDTRMKEFLPLLIERMPHLFEKDRYNRIDNIVPEDKKPFVMEEIRKSGLPSTEMIRKLDLLNRTGEYYDT